MLCCIVCVLHRFVNHHGCSTPDSDCVACQKKKRKGPKPYLRPIRPVSPYFHLQMDMFEKQVTSRGNRYGLCLIDMFSKYLWAACLPSKHAERVVQFLDSVVWEHGCFSKLQSDNAAEFSGIVLNDWCKKHNIGKVIFNVLIQCTVLIFFTFNCRASSRQTIPSTEQWRRRKSEYDSENRNPGYTP